MPKRSSVFLSALFLTLVGCASQYSSQQTLAEDSYVVFKETYKAFAEAEARYMNILFNLERMPEEEELWMMKRDQIAELEQLRNLMLQARGDLDDAMKAWDIHLQEKLAEIKQGKTFKSPNLKMSEQNRSSPGEMLPSEAAKIGASAQDFPEDF